MLALATVQSALWHRPPAPQSIEEEFIKYEIVEYEEDRRAQSLEPEHRAKENDHQERHNDNLHHQQPTVHLQARVEQHLEKEGGREKEISYMNFKQMCCL